MKENSYFFLGPSNINRLLGTAVAAAVGGGAAGQAARLCDAVQGVSERRGAGGAVAVGGIAAGGGVGTGGAIASAIATF